MLMHINYVKVLNRTHKKERRKNKERRGRERTKINLKASHYAGGKISCDVDSFFCKCVSSVFSEKFQQHHSVYKEIGDSLNI